ncbi:hypothetical protein GGS26DRAFT_596806 [Hypomontagnella submonticulosa]|nr:hypothetical protein GGS26DRAFT_596806 [Hypomontagnella submonticulosa]
MDNEFQGEPNPEDEGAQHQQPVPNAEPHAQPDPQEHGGDVWEFLWTIIVHRNGGVIEINPPHYPRAAWSLGVKEPVFPFNLEATWYCAALLALILGLHCELDTKWLLRHGYWHYAWRISSRIMLTVFISILSTIAFEVFGNVLDQVRESITNALSFHIRAWFVEKLGWGPVDQEGRADWNNGIPLHEDPTHLREPIRNAVSGIAILAFEYLVLILSSAIPETVAIGSASLTHFASNGAVSLVDKFDTGIALSTPDPDSVSSYGTLFWEYGVPVPFQIWIAALIYLLVFLFMSRAETPVILGRGGQDPFCKLAFQLLRATAMHLLAYTAYQVACICVVAVPHVNLVDGTSNFLRGHRLFRRIRVDFFPIAGLLVLSAHWLVKGICKIFVRLCWPLWVHYIVWLSIKTELYTRRNWRVYGPLLDEDMEVLNPDKRVTARAVMTAIFGLTNSWPARMRLSTVDGID